MFLDVTFVTHIRSKGTGNDCMYKSRKRVDIPRTDIEVTYFHAASPIPANIHLHEHKAKLSSRNCLLNSQVFFGGLAPPIHSNRECF